VIILECLFFRPGLYRILGLGAFVLGVAAAPKLLKKDERRRTENSLERAMGDGARRRAHPYNITSCPSNEERMNSIDEELIEAAKENNLPEVRRLMSAGADVNAKDSGGDTPFHWVSLRGHVQIFKELVEHGADIEVETIYGLTPLHLACSFGHVPVVIELLNPNDSNGATTTTILGKRKSRAGANTEAKDSQGDTPLHCACYNDHMLVVKPAVIKYLLQQLYATTCRLPLHELLEDLTWIGDPFGVGVRARMMSWRSLSIWWTESQNCSVLVTVTVHCHST
jgi:ankyrin repeat protein